MEAIVLAGGFGTRLATVVKDVPKPMAPVDGKPFLQYILDDLINKGVDKVSIAVCYKKECIKDFFGNSYRDAKIIYSDEDVPLFTGGAIKKAAENCTEKEVFVINGDTYFDVNLKDMQSEFQKTENAKIMIAVKELSDFSRYGKVDVEQDGLITSFHEKEYCEKGYINGGIYLMKTDVLKDCPQKFSLESEFFPVLQKEQALYAYKSDGFFIDIGIPSDYAYAQTCFKDMF